jgi:hypothetical protein
VVVTSINVFSVLTSVVGVGVGVNKELEVKGLEVGRMLLVDKLLLVTKGVVEAAVLCDELFDVLEAAGSLASLA